MSIVVAFLMLGVVIIIHEFGHFLLAKTNGVIVDEFSVGMGPRLLSTKRGDTRYSLKLIPFGGSCMMRGEDGDDLSEGSFYSRSVWRRISVVAAGPVFNFLLAFVGAVIVMGTVGYDSPEVLSVEEGSPEAEAGLMEGDVITRFDGESIALGRDLYAYMYLHGLEDKEIDVTVLRDGETVKLTWWPETEFRYMLGFSYTADETQASVSPSIGGALEEAGVSEGDIIVAINGTSIATGAELSAYFEENPLDGETVSLTYLHKGLEHEIEVTPQATNYVVQNFTYNLGREKTSPLNVLKYSVMELRYCIRTTLQSFKMLLTGKIGMESLSGPVGVVSVIGDTYEETKSEGLAVTFLTMLNMMILISANLGVANLLPLPALDGGRLVFLLIEAVRGRAVNRNAESMVHFVGLLLLMGLLLIVTFKDIRSLF